MISLTDDEAKIVKSILRSYVPDCKVLVYGSRLSGDHKPWSDLDLSVIGKEKLPLTVLGELIEAFTESSLNFIVDVHDWNSTSQNFQEIILRNYEVIQENEHINISVTQF